MSNSWERVDIYYNLLEVQLLPENVNLQQININNIQEKRPKTSVATTPDTITLEYYQLIYTHCKQRFNIPDRIEVVKKSVYQYIENHINNYLFGNYNISEVRSNLYNNLVHYSQLRTEDLNSETLATYFQELNFNIIKYCEETYLVQFQYSIDFELETETSNKDKQKLKQYLKTTPNTPILPKKTAKYLQTLEQGTTVNEENNSEISKEESIDSENEEDKITAYIAKIPEFNGEDIETSPQKWLNQVTKAGDANGWNAARMLKTISYFLKGTADKLIKKVCPHAPKDLNSAIQHAKRYEMAMEEANCTKLVNLAIRETSSAAEEKIDQLTKKNFHHTALSEGRAAAQQQNFSYAPTTIPPARIAENTNLSDIFSFEFEANESPFLLSNAAANEQKAITAMYTEAETIIVTANGMKKTPVEEIDNFSFTIDGITIPVKVMVMNAPQYQALVRNNWLQKANANLNWKTQELTISYQGQHTWVLATCGTFNKCSKKALAFEFKLEEKKPIIETFMALGLTSNWANKTEQQYFSINDLFETKKPVTTRWNVLYSKPEPRKQCPYISLKCKDCHKKLSSMRACISPEEEYKSHTCYYCKACH
ncbi:hypothetical protein G9A89_004192 [Geosiphon pyriformis]|nr:hypothetical protein G9A89_004192 [Geosiphon pyriformis]